MRQRLMLGTVILLLGAAAVLVPRGDVDTTVDLESAGELWGDLARDADGIGLRLTRVSGADEMRFGREVYEDHMRRATAPPSPWAAYVDAVGQSVAAQVQRTDIAYRFHVEDEPVINAFALPGGTIVVFAGLLTFLTSEAELAAVLGHEIAHVDLRHCIGRWQYQLKLRKVGLGDAGAMADMLRTPMEVTYTQYQEAEADAVGVRYAALAGYDPAAAAAPFERLAAKGGGEDRRAAENIEQELARSVAGAVGSFGRSHPPTRDRIHRLEGYAARQRGKLANATLYRGVENYRLKKTIREQPIAGEVVR